MIITGPSGCGKNTLLDLYCKENQLWAERFTDQKENHIYDVFGERTTFGRGEELYPDDLENLLYFLRINTFGRSNGQKS